MKILDEKGRLWGRINLLDLIIILGIVLITIIVIRFFLINDGKNDKMESYLVTIAPFTESTSYYNAIKTGDVELDPENKKIARIIQVDEVNKTVLAQISAVKDKQDIIFKRRKIKINSRIGIETEHVVIEGIITNMQTYVNPEQYISAQSKKLTSIIVKIKLYEKDPWFTDAVQEGDKEVILTQIQPITIAKIIKKEILPSLIISVEKDTAQEVAHPSKHDLLLTVELKCEREHDAMTFKGQSIKIGAEIIIETDDLIIQGEIIHVGSAETDN